MSLPVVSLAHLFRMSDDTGLFEHARGALPRRQCGYCLDDVARGLLVLSRLPAPSTAEIDLAGRYLAFVAHAQDLDGTCHNRLGYDRRWEDQPSTGDWWGRAVWALGAVATSNLPPWQKAAALDHFAVSASTRSEWPRAMAFAALGSADVLSVHPGHFGARHLLVDALGSLPRPQGDGGWPWPEDRLSYANAVLPEALLAVGAALDDEAAVTDGLRMLEWLVDIQTAGDHLSVVPVGGSDHRQWRPGFDQQSIETAALADACWRALALTGEVRWFDDVKLCVGWFLGDNDSGTVMYDPLNHGGYDGLQPVGANQNQGAESTLAWVLTLQRGHLLKAPSPTVVATGR